MSCLMCLGERLVFLADCDGSGNVWSCDLQGQDLRKHTRHTLQDARYASCDGQSVVYTVAGQLWCLLGLEKEAYELQLSLGRSTLESNLNLLASLGHFRRLKLDVRTSQQPRGSLLPGRGRRNRGDAPRWPPYRLPLSQPSLRNGAARRSRAAACCRLRGPGVSAQWQGGHHHRRPQVETHEP